MKKLRTIAIVNIVGGGLVVMWLAMPQWFEGAIALNEKEARRTLLEIAAAQKEYINHH